MNDVLKAPIIDPRNERFLTEEAKRIAFQRSEGTLNDFSTHGPLDVLVRSQAFAAAEMLFYANNVPLASAIKFLELTGVVQREGSKATTTLRFEITAPRPGDFFIPSGFEVRGSYLGETYVFFTDELLTIPAGATTGTVNATAQEVGSAYNVPSGVLRQFIQPLAFLSSVTNPSNAQNGSDAQSDNAVISQALRALRFRGLVSERDFEDFSQQVMGVGSRARAVGLLSLDKNDPAERGSVHLFLLDTAGNPANSALITDVQLAIEERRPAGTKIYISPMDVLDIRGDIIAAVEEEVDPETVSDGLWKAFITYFNPSQYEPGQDVLIREVEHALRFTEGISYIDLLELNDASINISVGNRWTIPRAFALNISLTSPNGSVFNVLRGNGEPVGFSPD